MGNRHEPGAPATDWNPQRRDRRQRERQMILETKDTYRGRVWGSIGVGDAEVGNLCTHARIGHPVLNGSS